MLYLNLTSLFKERGITKPVNLLVKAGFTYYAANELANGRVRSLSLKHLERLCIALNCTPNDVLAWRREEGSAVHDKHPLHKLSPKPDEMAISDVLLQLPVEKLQEVRQFVKGLEGVSICCVCR